MRDAILARRDAFAEVFVQNLNQDAQCVVVKMSQFQLDFVFGYQKAIDEYLAPLVGQK